MTAQSTTTSELIEIDLPCSGCGYNLRTQARDRVCPECATSIADSLHAYDVRHAELGELRESGLPWLREMREGIAIALIAFILSLSGFAYGAEDIVLRYESKRSPLWLIPFVVTYILSCAASWKLMAARRRRRALVVGRSILVISVLVVPMMFVDERLIPVRRSALYDLARAGESLFEVTERCAAVATLTWPLLIAATFGRFVQLAWVGRRRILSIVFALIGLGTSLLAGLMTYAIARGYMLSRPEYSSELAPLLFGPTGTLPAFWAGVGNAARHLGFADFRYAGALDIAGMLLAFLICASVFSTGFLLFSLLRTLTRAILLSEESAANSRSSPSPHPEVQSR